MTRMRPTSLAVAPYSLLLPLLLLTTTAPPAPAYAFQVSHQFPIILPPRSSFSSRPSSRARWIRVADTGITVPFENGNGQARRRAFASTSTRPSGECTRPILPMIHMSSRSGGDDAEDVSRADATRSVSTSEQPPPPKMSHPATDEELSAMDAWLSAKMREEEGWGRAAENRVISTTAAPRMSSPATNEELFALDEWLGDDEDDSRDEVQSRISHDGQSSSSSLELEDENTSPPPGDSSTSTEDHVMRGVEGASSGEVEEEAAVSNRPPRPQPMPKTTPSPPREGRRRDRTSGEDRSEVLRRRRRIIAYGQRTCAATYAAACSASLASLGVSPRSEYAAAGPFLASGLSHVLACEAAADDDHQVGRSPSEGVFEGLDLALGVYAAMGISAAILAPQNRNPFWLAPCILSFLTSLLGYRYGSKGSDQPETALPPVRSVVRNLRAGLAKVPGCDLRSRTYLAAAFATGCMSLVKLREIIALVILGRGDHAVIAGGRLLRCAKLGLLTAVTVVLGGAAADAGDDGADRGDGRVPMGTVTALTTLNLSASVGFGTLAAYLFDDTSPLTAGIGGSVAAAFAIFSALDGVTSTRTRRERLSSSSSDS